MKSRCRVNLRVWNYDPIFRGLKLVVGVGISAPLLRDVWNYDPIFRGLKLRHQSGVTVGDGKVWNYDPIFRGLKLLTALNAGKHVMVTSLEL